MATVEDLIKNALKTINFLSVYQTLDSNVLTDCFNTLNRMVDSWIPQRRFVYEIARYEYPFAVSKASYTLGPAGDFAINVRPREIDHANVVITADDLHIPVGVRNFEEYAGVAMPTLSGEYPSEIYYRPGWPNGTIYPYPYPTEVLNKLEIFVPRILEKFTSTAQTLSLAPGYEHAITQSVAELYCEMFGRPLTAELERSARKAREVLTASNSRSLPQSSDYPAEDGGGMQWDERIHGWI